MTAIPPDGAPTAISIASELRDLVAAPRRRARRCGDRSCATTPRERHFEQLWRDDARRRLGHLLGAAATTPASTTTTSRAARSPSSRARSSRSASWSAARRAGCPIAPARRSTSTPSHVHRMRQDGDGAGRVDPRLLAAAVADGRLRRRGGWHAAPALDLLRRGAAARRAGGLEALAWVPTGRSPASSAQTRSVVATNSRAAGSRSRSRCHARPMSRGGSPISSSTARTPGWPASTLSRGSSAAPIPWRRARGSSRRRWSERRRAGCRAGGSRAASRRARGRRR